MLKGLDNYLLAGKIASRVRDEIARKILPGKTFLEIAEECDRRIEELGGKPAFPINISADSVAAHYTPFPGDGRVFSNDSIIKLDLGVHVEGYPADTAVTVCLGERGRNLKEAAEAALLAAAKRIAPGVPVSEIGEAIETEIKSRGLSPIYNLTGHSIERWNLHAGLSIPNYKSMKGKLPEEGVFAIEPFATDGKGFVSDSEPSRIFMVDSGRQGRLTPGSKSALAAIRARFSTLPFASRWLSSQESAALFELRKSGAIFNFPVLVEKSGGLVGQAEHTFLISEGKAVATTES